MRMSLVGSIGCPGSVYSSRLPLPLVSRMNGVQPCDFSASWVSSYIFVFSQPTLSPPGLLNQTVLLASSANIRCCVLVHRSTSVHWPVLGSSKFVCRELFASGSTIADSSLEAFLQESGFPRSRVAAAVQIRPLESIIKLCAVA